MASTMQAIVFHGDGKWGLESAPQPQLAAHDDVLLRVDRAGICGTDLHILSTPPGHPATPGSILGHEYVATVVDAGDGVTHLQRGDHVVIDPNITCGLCQYCRAGMTNVCERMTTLGIFRHGGLAEYNVAPAKALHRISNDVPVERAALAEPLACVWHAFEKAQLTPGESVAILGAGPIGLLFQLLFKAAGAGKVFLVEPADYRRQTAEELGADGAFTPADSVEAIKAATGLGADIVVDAVGSLLPEALQLVRFGGRVILFGMNLHAERTLNQYHPTRYEITIIGSFIQRTAFPKVVRALESNIVPVEKLITHRIGLGELGAGLEALRNGRAIKVLVQP
ncbi:MAG: alcohol dehydrogenase catalytic domain-containing protein [Acidobacteria bacterium]|nr:alcohol dehydrogenase catalytic domain-containing protein [Acidobacteriota bacterium]MBI3427622.1 alcohol dehydrogenase catalytic domain-containing protein [Acidobacteriota bacterium]